MQTGPSTKTAVPVSTVDQNGSLSTSQNGSLETFMKAHSGDFEPARALLDARMRLLASSARCFNAAADEIECVYSTRLKNSAAWKGLDELPDGATRQTMARLLNSFPPELKQIWFNLGEADAASDLQLLKLFGWNFNLMKVLDQGDEGPSIKIRTRNSGESFNVPYPMHTHVDVPYAMHLLGIGKSRLAICLAASHDATEEGRQLVRRDGAVALEELSPGVLTDMFPEGGLGAQLKVGIQALTETTYKDIKAKLHESDISDVSTLATELLARELPDLQLSQRAVEKVHWMDPMVYGGLALQIRDIVRELMADPTESRTGLAQAIVEVEIGDRIAEIASLRHYLVKSASEPVAGRHKIVALASRMINMHEKLGQALSFFSGESKESLQTALDSMLSVLVLMVKDMGPLLNEMGLPAVWESEIYHYHTSIFSPIQQQVDRPMAPLVAEKVNGILSERL